jgi:amino acid transporter
LEAEKLKRSITMPYLALYGLGTMLGAGIFALIGEVASEAGVYAPLSFLLAAAIAGLTGMSFAELSSRYPKAAGEAAYVSAGYSSRWLPPLVGLLIAGSGIVSSGVMFRSFVGYAAEFIDLPIFWGTLGLTLIMSGIAAWGVVVSMVVVAVITAVEACVLILIVLLGTQTPGIDQAFTGTPSIAAAGILSGSVLAFYAFIGFEDMVNMAEEVKRPRKSIPRAIILALSATAVIYVAVAWTAMRVTPIDELAQSSAPMSVVFSKISDVPSQWVSLVAMIAVINGALVQIMMASRVLYGLGGQGHLPAWFAEINPRTQTPVRSTGVVAVCIFLVAILFPLGVLAKITSFLLLVVFAIVNIVLIRIKNRNEPSPETFLIPIYLPWMGAIATTMLALVSIWQLLF